MSIEYPPEILAQQVKVRKELERLAKMRTDYLKSTGQMPPSGAKNTRVSGGEDRAASSPDPKHTKVTAS